MAAFIDFMNQPVGRVLRVIAGLLLIGWAVFFSGGTVLGWVLGIIGVVPLVMGIWGRCLVELWPGGHAHAV